MFSKLTRVFASTALVLAVFVAVTEYKDIRHYEELREKWRGQEKGIGINGATPQGASASPGGVFYRNGFAVSNIRIGGDRYSSTSIARVIFGDEF
jgi:hypothetical protein